MNVSFQITDDFFKDLKNYQISNFKTDDAMMKLLWLKKTTYYRLIKTKKLSSEKIEWLRFNIKKNKLPFKI